MPDTNPSAPAVVPNKRDVGLLDVEDIRHFIWDRTVEDNPIELDLTFSDTEIGHAFRYAAMMYNGIAPHINEIDGPKDVIDKRLTYAYMLATVYHLFLAKAAQLSRQDIDYSAGNATVDFTKRRIEYLTKWAGLLKEESMASIQNYKFTLNLYGGFCAH